ncbi:MAG TPA: HPF/RaiA family ribosome-associated protein [Rhodocyclaceae bacterium]
MQFDIQSRGFDLTHALRDHVRRRLLLELSWATDHVGKVTVRLSDLNGPRGGPDKRCRIQISALRSSVVVEDVEEDLYIAIGRAADRAGRTLSRRIARHREHRAVRMSRPIEPQSAPATSHLMPPGEPAGATQH